MYDSKLRVAIRVLAIIHLVLCGIGAIGMPILVLQIIPQHIYPGPPPNFDPNHPETAGPVPAWHYIILIVGGYLLLTFHAAAAVILLKATVKKANPQTAVKFAEGWAIASIFLYLGWAVWIIAIGYYVHLAVAVMVFANAFQFAVVGRYTEWQKVNVIKMRTSSTFRSYFVNNEA